MTTRFLLPALAAAGLFSCAAIALAQDSSTIIAGWSLADVGHKPGDDSDRLVSIEKVIPEIDLIYRPSESNTGGSIQAEFKPQGRCAGLSLSSGFDFDAAPADRATQVRKEVHDAFVDFTKNCPTAKPGIEAELMVGFGEAFAAVNKLMIDKPNVYPKDPAEDGNSQ